MRRTYRDSAYGQQIQEATPEQFASYNCEEGALVKVAGYIYVGIGGLWRLLYPASAESLNLGFQVLGDGQYTPTNTYDFSANTEYTMPNDATLDIRENLSVYKQSQQLFLLDDDRDTWSLTISFKAHMNTNNAHMELYIENTANRLYQGCSEILVFPKGNGVEHAYQKTFVFYSDTSSTTGGIQVKFKGSHSGSMYDVQYFIQNIQNHA